MAKIGHILSCLNTIYIDLCRKKGHFQRNSRVSDNSWNIVGVMELGDSLTQTEWEKYPTH